MVEGWNKERHTILGAAKGRTTGSAYREGTYVDEEQPASVNTEIIRGITGHDNLRLCSISTITLPTITRWSTIERLLRWMKEINIRAT